MDAVWSAALFVNVQAASSRHTPTTSIRVTAVIFGFFAIKRMRARSVFLPETIVVAQSTACMGARLMDIWSRSVLP